MDACWFSHDGQWFLKVKDRFGLETAMELNGATVRISRCFIAEMAAAANLEGMGIGNFPGCRGFRRRVQGWGLVLSSRYDFIDAERPGEPGSGFVCRHRIERLPRGS